MNRFDHIVLTAANAAQARGYRTQIDWRLRSGRLDTAARYHVVPDPGGRRVGSLGATIHALRAVARDLLKRDKARSLDKLFAGRRVLICHSGGDSRRLPAYAAQGKIFTPLPTGDDGTTAALFDLILDNVQRLPAPPAGQVLIYTGDVLLTFDPAATRFDRPGVVGVAYPGSIETAGRHGVYVTDPDVMQTGFAPVRDFLQKPDEPTARQHDAIDPVGRVLIDTGIVSLDPPTTAKLLDHAGLTLRDGKLVTRAGLMKDLETGKARGLDLYLEYLTALAPKVTRRRYAKAVGLDEHDAAQRQRIEALYDAVRRVKFHVNVLPDCDFFHIGSSREFLANIATLNRTAEAYGFADMHGSTSVPGTSLEGAFVYQSILDHAPVRCGPATLVEGCDVDVPVELPGRNVLVGLPADGGVPIKLAAGLGLVVLPVGQRDWAAVCFGLNDDFKGTADGERGCTFLNEPIGKWQRRHGVDDATLWPRGAAKSLWEARLWPVGTLEQVLGEAKWIAGPGAKPQAAGAWTRAKRLSMKQLIKRVNHRRLIDHRQSINRRVDLARLDERLLADDALPAKRVVEQIASREEAAAALGAIGAAIGQADSPLFESRACKLAQLIAERHRVPRAKLRQAGFDTPAQIEQRAFGAIRRAVSQAVAMPDAPRGPGILHDQVVWVTTPVRLDFSGGWSDTPPFCTERGGTVVNAAITLNGQYPVQAMAKLNEDRVIRLSSIDLGRTQTIARTEQLLAYTDPRDWGALPKAAMVLAGIGPADRRQSLGRWLDKLGGGLDLTIFSALPKGSGLGTSSVLGAAVLACLDRVLGRDATHDELIARTSVLEQMMTTGGGWQDQVGGVFGGVKLITTQPGADQAATLRWIGFDMAADQALRDRLLLYFTGQKRMARNILQNVVGRYLARDPEALRTIDELKDAALRMKADLDRRDVDAFGKGIERYWTLKKRLDPGSTNEPIERLIARIDRWCVGKCLPGAGGGGFVFIVARDTDAAQRIRKTLTAHPPNGSARFFDFDVDPTGLKITTL